MILRQPTTRRNEAILWALCLMAALLLGAPLIAYSAGQATWQAAIPVQEGNYSSQGSDAGADAAPEVPAVVLSRVALDLDALAQANSVDEADNMRWSLIRRTPAAALVYTPETGVDWSGLRGLSQTGTILLPAGFTWSFNETFQQGPGYKVASGILAGGHCALATVFRAAAEQAGLPVKAKTHAWPIPGFPLEQTVNIFWGRDDLLVHNDTGQEFVFVWALSPEGVEVTIVSGGSSAQLPALPGLQEATVAMVYGRPGPGGWGSLGQTTIADHALDLARSYAERVDQWNGNKKVIVAVNPNVAAAGQVSGRDLYLYYLIAEARRQGYYVMLDIQSGDQPLLPLLNRLMDQFLQENVWFDWDIEHATGGKVDAEQINQAAAAYFARRQARGYQAPGVFGFYIFKADQVTNPGHVQRSYDGGYVVPIFDGFGGRGQNPALDKIAKTAGVLSLFGDEPYGIMEFETRWGNRYDQISAQSYFEAFPNALVVASQ